MIDFKRFTKESRALVILALPIIISQLSIQGMNFVDTSMAGRASPRDLAAVAIGGSLWMPMSLLLRGILMALTPTIAWLHGARQEHRVAHELLQAIWIGGGCSLLLILFLNLSEPIMTYMAVAPEIIPIADGYLLAISFGVPAVTLFYALNSVFEGLGRTRVPMVVSVAGLLLNIPVNYVLIYGKLGFPAMGAIGCGWERLMRLLHLMRIRLFFSIWGALYWVCRWSAGVCIAASLFTPC